MVRTARSLNISLDALAAAEPAFARTMQTHGRPEPRLSQPGVESLLRTIVGQQVSVAAARSMWNKLSTPGSLRRGSGRPWLAMVRAKAGSAAASASRL